MRYQRAGRTVPLALLTALAVAAPQRLPGQTILDAGPAIRLGNMGMAGFAADGEVFAGPVAIGAPNPSGYAGSSTGQSIVLGCTRTAAGTLDESCAANGVNGGFGAPGLAGLQAMLRYGGVDAVGQFIGAGPYQPPTFPGVALSGQRGTHVTLPNTRPVPEAFRRVGTWVQLSGLTSTLVGAVSSVAMDGLSFDVTAWGDQSSKAVGVDARDYAITAGNHIITATVGYVTSLFGYNHVVVVYPNGPAQAVGGETDVVCDRPGSCQLNTGVSVNGTGNYPNGTGLSCNGGVGGNADVPIYRPAWTDCLSVRGFSYRGIYVEMNFDGTIANNATTGVYVDTIGSDGKFPLIVHNLGAQTADGTGNVFRVDAVGNVTARDIQVAGLIAPGIVHLAATKAAPFACELGTLGAHLYILDGRKPNELPGSGSGVPADCTPSTLHAAPSWVSVYDREVVQN